jgi:alpha-D-xyloside xylohydrolase
VPAGRWTRFTAGPSAGRTAGEVVEGPRWVRETHGFDSVPLLVRPGSVIAVGAREDRPEYDYAHGVTLRLFEPVEGSRTVTVPALDGTPAATFVVTRAGSSVRVERTGDPALWRVQIGDRLVELAADESSCELRLPA